MKECLTDPGMVAGLKAGSSQDTTDGSSSKRRHSESFNSEASGSCQRPDAEAHSGDMFGEGKLKREPECHMELDKLSANRNHTVLIDVRASTVFESGTACKCNLIISAIYGNHFVSTDKPTFWQNSSL